MRIPNALAAALAAGVMLSLAACEQAVDSNPALRNTKGGHAHRIDTPTADGTLDLPQSATIDAAEAERKAREGGSGAR